jgi:hypothetical protein
MKKFILLFLSVFICLTTAVSYAKNDNNLLLNLTDCAAISNNNIRLACFDKLVPRQENNPIVEVTTVVSTTVDKKSVQQKNVDGFAKEHLKKPKAEQGPSSLFSTVTKVKQLLRGQWVIYLKNGQKWQQTDTARINIKVGNKIRLDKGAMGAIYLYKEGSQRNIKVKRLK